MKEENIIHIMDNNLTGGHHLLYLNALKSIDNVEDISKNIELNANIKKIVPYIKNRTEIFNYSTRKIMNNSTLHFVYIDSIYMIGAFYNFRKDIKLIGTLHHYPLSKTKQMLLKKFCEKLECVIVHSEFIACQLKACGIKNSIVVEYPVFHVDEQESYWKLEEIKIKEGISLEKIVISALGATRHDKGLDILLNSLKHLSSFTKENIIINIAGSESTFKKEFIESKLAEVGVNARIKLGFLSDMDFTKNILISDAIILPYRSYFTGNSGPMTEAAYRNKVIIGPNSGNLGYLIKEYNLGYVFDAEDEISLANSIDNYILNGWNINEQSKHYREKLTLENFIFNYKRVYEQVNMRYV